MNLCYFIRRRLSLLKVTSDVLIKRQEMAFPSQLKPRLDIKVKYTVWSCRIVKILCNWGNLPSTPNIKPNIHRDAVKSNKTIQFYNSVFTPYLYSGTEEELINYISDIWQHFWWGDHPHLMDNHHSEINIWMNGSYFIKSPTAYFINELNSEETKWSVTMMMIKYIPP